MRITASGYMIPKGSTESEPYIHVFTTQRSNDIKAGVSALFDEIERAQTRMKAQIWIKTVHVIDDFGILEDEIPIS